MNLLFVPRGLMVAAALATAPFVHAAVSLPFSADFSDTSDFNPEGGTWSVVDGNYRNVLAANQVSSSSVQITSGLENGFLISTTFRIASNAGGSTSMGVAALGTNPALTSGSASAPFLLADVTRNRVLRLVLVNGNNPAELATLNLGAGFASNITSGVTYTLSLAGVYTSGGLELTLKFSNDTTEAVLPFTLASSQIPAGSYFGLRNRANGGSSNLTIDTSEFSVVAIPEPAAASVVAVGVLAGLLRRSRR